MFVMPLSEVQVKAARLQMPSLKQKSAPKPSLPKML
jgi:hypothetical protein